MKYTTSDKFPNLTLTTVRGETLNLPDPSVRFIHVQFRRWSGCPICNLHIASLRRNADRINRAGIREVLFFHSKPEEILEFQKDLPFDMIGDPGKVYYKRFGVESSLKFFLSFKTLWAALRGLLSGNFNLKMGGGPHGLPADFLVAADGRIVAVKYGTSAYDQWSVDELIALTQDASRPALAIVEGALS